MLARSETQATSFRSSLTRFAFMVGIGVTTALLALLTAPSYAEIIDDDTPVPAVGELGGPSRILTPEELEKFKRGRKLFDRDRKQSQGLGIDMNADSCRSCHQTPVIGGGGDLDVNVYRFARDFGGAGPFEDLPGGQMGSKIRRPNTPGREDHHPDSDVFEQRQTKHVIFIYFCRKTL